MGSFFAYELAPLLPSLFHGGAMQKPIKSYLRLLLKIIHPTNQTAREWALCLTCRWLSSASISCLATIVHLHCMLVCVNYIFHASWSIMKLNRLMSSMYMVAQLQRYYSYIHVKAILLRSSAYRIISMTYM